MLLTNRCNSLCFCLVSFCVFSSKVEMGKWIEDLNLAIDMAKKSQEKSSIFLDAGLSDRSNRKINLSILCRCTVTTVLLSGERLLHVAFYILPCLKTKLFWKDFSLGHRIVWRGFSGAGVGGWHELLPDFTGQPNAPPCQHNHACVLAPQHQCVYVRSQLGCGGTPPLPTLRHIYTHVHTQTLWISMQKHKP